jgi:hypothetical protein
MFRKSILFGLLLGLMANIYTPAAKAELSIGIGYPFLGLKYDFMPEIAGEIKYASTGQGIWVIAGRGYWNLLQTDKINVFSGIEFGQINFNHLDISGDGQEYGPFVGIEYNLAANRGLTLDIAPTFIDLKSQGIINNGLEWVITAGFYWRVF